MTNTTSLRLSETLLRLARESSARGSGLHRRFLSQREFSLQGMKTLIEMQIHAVGGTRAVPAPMLNVERPCVFNSAQLTEFGTGKMSDCFGPAFKKYDGKRMPRIPNGDLKMMSRVMEITGVQGDYSFLANIVVEHDIPATAWYVRDNAGPELPFSLVMETALQPCGFMMAYQDTFAALPSGEYYFRNLDGWITVDAGHEQEIAGKVIHTRARILSSVVSSGILMQKFAFELSCGGKPFCRGETLFGYFPEAAMASQVGLDGGKSTPTWLQQHAEQAGVWIDIARRTAGEPSRPRFRLSSGQMNFLDQIFVNQKGGRYGKGYIYGLRNLRADDWFYPYHFYQDPVMPGSLGVEAILQCGQAFALESKIADGLRSPRFGLAENLQTLWRYRGQIVQARQKMEIDFHVNSVQHGPEGVTLAGDASLWADGLRIYEVKNAAIAIKEG